MTTAKKHPLPSGTKLIAHNKNARRHYELLETLEAGIALMGSEVKSLREGRVSFKDSYVHIHNGQATLKGLHIAVYEHATYTGHEPERPRPLLLHKKEILYLDAKVQQKGLALIPVRLYFKRGRVKLELALGKGKKLFDRRNDIKARDIQRDTQREMTRYN